MSLSAEKQAELIAALDTLGVSASDEVLDTLCSISRPSIGDLDDATILASGGGVLDIEFNVSTRARIQVGPGSAASIEELP